jgi:protein-S-isoprenylcysteine O-methyltransferase Ste14
LLSFNKKGYITHLLLVASFSALIAICIWFVEALHSSMDENIRKNRLKPDGIYVWVRSPMYSGWWMLIAGISLMWHNVWLLATPLINWGIMTVVLKNTEDYCKRVNCCVL